MPIYSFLSVCWAVIADCDLNSEVLRCLGPVRFTIWGVWRCLALIRYQGSLACTGTQIRNRNGAAYLDGDTDTEQGIKQEEALLASSSSQHEWNN